MTIRTLTKVALTAATVLAATAGFMTGAQADTGLSGSVNGDGGKCLDVRAAGTANGTAVQLYDCNGTGAQTWTYSGGTLSALGKCLDVTSGGTADRTPVQLYDCNGTGAQQWTYPAGGSLGSPQPGDGVLVNPQSGKCLDVPGGNAVNGTQLQIYTCNYSAAQQWSQPVPQFQPTQPGPSVQQQVLDLVNTYRAQNGKPALQADPALARTAQDEANAESAHGQQGHFAFGDMSNSLRAYGYAHPIGALAENAAGAPGFWTDAQSVVQAWTGDALHRNNILGDYTYTGVGLTVANGTYWWAQDFAA
ncbi:CAP domain-containing protein [Kitasatospora sp. NBC_01250]|uniref:CAP domain-containing protein n=1 Tax=Kitasatospora sp. NBC_01250 TaxID=2903571 RepID=UPI002E33BF53|nr:ricin-type beta-trefoil lectin domain protein [Kitasatospora sp. NBC_01250]